VLQLCKRDGRVAPGLALLPVGRQRLGQRRRAAQCAQRGQVGRVVADEAGESGADPPGHLLVRRTDRLERGQQFPQRCRTEDGLHLLLAALRE
jgi:hypothetical protein